MRPTGVLSALTALAAPLLFGACAGWHAGLAPPPGYDSTDGELVSAGSDPTVGVEMFATDRRVLERNLEPQVHVALTQALLDRVDAPLVSPREADYVVRGTILEYRRRSGIRNTDNDLLETGLRIVLKAELLHRESGQLVGEPITRRIWSSYALGGDNESFARDRGFRNLAGTLVNDLFRPLRTVHVEPGEDPEGAARATRGSAPAGSGSPEDDPS